MGSRLDELFAWRDPERSQSPQALVDSLTVEALLHVAQPPSLYEALRAFRHLSQASRLSVAKRYYSRKENT